MTQQSTQVKISAAQVVASALAAVASAVAASTLGVAGTLIGAAVGSVVATTATTAFLHSLERTKGGLRLARESALLRGRPSARGSAVAVAGPPPGRERRPFPGLHWQPVAVAAAVVFAVAFGGITAFELASGQSVAATVQGESAASSGTTIGDLVGERQEAPAEESDPDPNAEDPDAASAGQTPTLAATPEPTGSAATPEPTEPAATPEPTGSAATPEPTGSTATPDPSAPAPTATATAGVEPSSTPTS